MRNPFESPDPPRSEPLDAQATAFAQLIGLAPNDLDGAYRQAIALGAKLFPHQIDGVAFLLGRRRAILADDMGLGKTRQAIVSLRHASPGGPYLVVCPASVKRNWAREIGQAIPGCAIHIVEGGRAVPLSDSEWTIVNYDILSKHMDGLGRVPWAGVVFDEAHYLKNHTSARSRLARQLVESAARKAPREPPVYLLTGTPLTNRPRDLFVLLQLVGHSLGRSFLSFAKRYCAAEKTEYGWKTDGASNIEELTVQLHGVMLRRTKNQVLALPPKLRTWLPVDCPPGTGAREFRDLVDLLAERGRTGLDPGAVADGRRADTPAGPADESAAEDRGSQGGGCHRVRVRGRRSGREGDRVLVLRGDSAGARDHLRRCCGAADGTDARAEAAGTRGQVPAGRDRPGIPGQHHRRRRGAQPDRRDPVVFNDLDWVPANHWQAEDRAYRIGQTRTVNVTYLVARGTVDDFVQSVLETKAALVNAVVEGEALAGDLSGSVLDELQRALRAIFPGLADTPHRIVDERLVARLLEEASDTLRAAQDARSADVVRSQRPEDIEALRRAFEALARVLSAPSMTSLSHREHVASRRNLHRHDRRRGRDVQLSGLRVPGPVPSCARSKSGGGGRIGRAGGIRAGERRRIQEVTRWRNMRRRIQPIAIQLRAVVCWNVTSG